MVTEPLCIGLKDLKQYLGSPVKSALSLEKTGGLGINTIWVFSSQPTPSEKLPQYVKRKN